MRKHFFVERILPMEKKSGAPSKPAQENQAHEMFFRVPLKPKPSLSLWIAI